MTSSNGNIFCVTGLLCGEYTGRFDVFVDLSLNKRSSKQSRRGWFKTPPRLLWRHNNDIGYKHLFLRPIFLTALYSMWHSYAMWRHGSGATFDLVMARCLTAQGLRMDKYFIPHVVKNVITYLKKRPMEMKLTVQLSGWSHKRAWLHAFVKWYFNNRCTYGLSPHAIYSHDTLVRNR